MSGHICRTVTIGTTNDLNRSIEDGVKKLDDQQQRLFKEYLTIGQSPDALFLRECAAIAYQTFLDIHEALEGILVLTPHGLNIASFNGGNTQLTTTAMVWQEWEGGWDEYEESDASSSINQKHIADAAREKFKEKAETLLNFNLDFLDIWDQVRKKMSTHKDDLKPTSPKYAQAKAEANALIDKTTTVTKIPEIVEKILINDGFQITSSPMTSPSQALEQGILIEAINPTTKETREFIIGPEGSITTHVEIPGATHTVCMRAAEEFSNRISTAIKYYMLSFGLSANFTTKAQKAGKPEISKPKTTTRPTLTSGSQVQPRPTLKK